MPSGKFQNLPAIAGGILVFLAALSIYLATIAPTLSWGRDQMGVDGGDLLAAVETLGIPHPSGYPTYVIALKLFATVVPVGDLAFRGNLFSALLSAGTALLIYMVILRTSHLVLPYCPAYLRIFSGLIGAISFAATPLFWSQAIITEVYALNAFFSAALVLLACFLHGSTHEKAESLLNSNKILLMLFAFVAGISAGNHLTILSLTVPLVILLWSDLGRSRLLGFPVIISLIVGLSVYLYLPLRAAQHPAINWGDAASVGGIFWMTTASMYQEYVFGVGLEDLPDRLFSWVEITFQQFNPIGLFMGLLGLHWSFLKLRKYTIALLVPVVWLTIFSVSYRTFDAQVLMVVPFLLFSVFVGLGILKSVSSIQEAFNAWRVSSANQNGEPSKFAGGVLVAILGLLLIAVLPGTLVGLNFNDQNLRDNRDAYTHAQNRLEGVIGGSVILLKAEQDVFPVWYMTYVEETDRDMAPIAVRLLRYEWYREHINRLYPLRVPSSLSQDVSLAIEDLVGHNRGIGRQVYFSYWQPSINEVFELEKAGMNWRALLK